MLLIKMCLYVEVKPYFYYINFMDSANPFLLEERHDQDKRQLREKEFLDKLGIRYRNYQIHI